jgi:hypothetical protein
VSRRKSKLGKMMRYWIGGTALNGRRLESSGGRPAIMSPDRLIGRVRGKPYPVVNPLNGDIKAAKTDGGKGVI